VIARSWGFKSPLAHLVSDLFRPSRRRRLFWPILVVIGVAVGLAVALSSRVEQTPSLFAEDLRQQAVLVNRKAGTFKDLLGRMSSVDRVELVEVIDDIETSMGSAKAFLADAEPPAEAAGAAAILDLSLDLWIEGVRSFRDVLLGIADSDTLDGEDRLTDAFLALRSADRLYPRFVEALLAADIAEPVSPLPEVRFLPDSYPLDAAVRTLTAMASSDQSLLEQRASLRIQQVTTSPEWIRDTEDNLVIEQTDVLTIKVVVANQGNISTDAGAVLAILTSTDGTIQRVQAPVAELAAGAETTVELPPVEVDSASSYQLVVRLPAFDIDSPASFDSKTLQFRVNEPTPDTTTTSAG